jgi:hypothetical protein
LEPPEPQPESRRRAVKATPVPNRSICRMAKTPIRGLLQIGRQNAKRIAPLCGVGDISLLRPSGAVEAGCRGLARAGCTTRMRIAWPP